MNVAISRAKKQLAIVVTNDVQNKDGNISDLISYIQYNNMDVIDSKVNSVFDYLYRQNTESRWEYLKGHKRISEYNSENLMYVLIGDILKESFPTYDVVCHLPIETLLKRKDFLTDDELRYVNNGAHLDFLIYNSLGKVPILAIEVDGFKYHKDGTKQHERDLMKDEIMRKYGVNLLRLSTVGSGEKDKIITALS